MLKRLLAAALLVTSFGASAATVYNCDASVVNIPTGDRGSFIMDAGTIKDEDGMWLLTLNGDTGPATYHLPKMPLQSNPDGLPPGGVHYADKNQTYDFIPQGDRALMFITETTGTGNQLQMTCKLQK